MTANSKFYMLPKALAARKDLCSADKIVWAVLRDRIGDNGSCWPGVRSLGKDTGLPKSTVAESISRLENAGDLKVEHRSNGQSNRYYINETVPKTGRSEDQKRPESGTVTQVNRTKNRTVKEVNRPENRTPASGIQDGSVRNPGQNYTDPLNDTHKDSLRPKSDDFRLSELLLDLILERKPDFKKPNLDAWAKHVDRMIRLDGRKPERVEAVIRWSQEDSFWKNNILSTEKLRKQFDKLELKMEAKINGQKPRRHCRDFDGQHSTIGDTIAV
jgi:hypothetical protein